jgi:hypothetical protein
VVSAQQEVRIAEAIRHVQMGFAAFSVWSTDDLGTCKCGKAHPDGQGGIGKHPVPRDGFKAASRDPKMVTAMLSAGSEPNYGLVWPEDSPDGVVFEWDVDGTEWKHKIDDLKAKFGPLPVTKTTRTPSGGLHLFYRWPGGIAVPEGNTLHDFVARFPGKGYVVGPGSRINGSVYQDVGGHPIADLPLTWAVTGPVPAVQQPLIVVSDSVPGYELPDSVPTGQRHAEITRFVASRWNRGISKAEIEASIGVLTERFEEPASADKIKRDIDEAWDTAERKWKEPGGEPTYPPPLQDQSGNLIDPLAIESRIERPEPLDPHAVPIPTGIAMLLDHYRPFTDASWSSLILASCVVMSALVGPAPRLRWRATHRASLFGVLVGESNYGRKSQTINEVEEAFRQVDPLLEEITKSGIASPEKLVDILKDAKTNALGAIFIREHEITNMMVIASREGNVMSGFLRAAWDGAKLESHSVSRGSVTASGYSTSILGGVVPTSLRKYLTADDVANGWANRFLWFHAEPRPGGFDATADTTLEPGSLGYLRDCVEHARRMGGSALIRPMFTMHLSDEALAHMEAMAARLDVPPIGAIGRLRQRMPGHVVRLAMIAALFDQSALVEIDHVQFGEAMTAYAVESLRPVFGIRVDDPVAMLILEVLTQHGWQNTSNIRAAVGGKDHVRVLSALRLLLDEGLIVREDRASGPKGGRPSVGYRLKGV